MMIMIVIMMLKPMGDREIGTAGNEPHRRGSRRRKGDYVAS